MEGADIAVMDLRCSSGKTARWLTLVAAMLFAVSACGNAPATDGFGPVDKAVAELKLAQLGTIISDTRSGTDRPLTQQPTRQLVILARGGSQTAVNTLVASALAAHFEPTGATTFHRASGKGVLVVFYLAPSASGSAFTVSVTQQ